MFGKCKACEVHKDMVASLRDEIKFLRDLAHPPVNNYVIPASNEEANSVLDAIDRPMQISTYTAEQERLTEEELRERNAILSGDY